MCHIMSTPQVDEAGNPLAGGGGVFATEAQREWVKTTERTLRAARAVRPQVISESVGSGRISTSLSRRARAKAHAIVNDARFETAVLVAVIANVVLMASEHFGQPDALTRVSQVRVSARRRRARVDGAGAAGSRRWRRSRNHRTRSASGVGRAAAADGALAPPVSNAP